MFLRCARKWWKGPKWARQGGRPKPLFVLLMVDIVKFNPANKLTSQEFKPSKPVRKRPYGHCHTCHKLVRVDRLRTHTNKTKMHKLPKVHRKKRTFRLFTQYQEFYQSRVQAFLAGPTDNITFSSYLLWALPVTRVIYLSST